MAGWAGLNYGRLKRLRKMPGKHVGQHATPVALVSVHCDQNDYKHDVR
jgi:hypothetical protein